MLHSCISFKVRILHKDAYFLRITKKKAAVMWRLSLADSKKACLYTRIEHTSIPTSFSYPTVLVCYAVLRHSSYVEQVVCQQATEGSNEEA